MAKTTNTDSSTNGRYEAVVEPIAPNTLLKIKTRESGIGIKVICDRIYYVSHLSKQHISADEILVLSTSEESSAKINEQLKLSFQNSEKIRSVTFTQLTSVFLSEHFKNWSILKEKKIKEILAILGGKSDISYKKIKVSIQQLSAVTVKSLKHMNEHELRVRYGVDREEALKVKKAIEDVFYVPYSQVIEEVTRIPMIFSDLNKYKFICVANFHNLRKEEARFLVKLGVGKHVTVLAHDSTEAKPKLFEENWNFISSVYEKAKVKEIYLAGRCPPETKDYQKDTKKKSDALIDQILKSKISLSNVEQVVEVMMKVLSNKNANLPFLQLISLIPGFDNVFLSKFCKLVSSENNSVYDFLMKYQDSLSDKTKAKLLPVLKYLTKIENKLDKTNANSVMIHLLNLCKAVGVDTQATEDMKNEFVELHLWLKFLQNNEDLRVSDDLIECYIANGSFKSKPESNHLLQAKDGKPMEATVNFKLPVSITMKSPSVHKERATAEVKIENLQLRRSNSSKYKPRPCSWHAGTIANAARKIR